ncbi:MAG: FtsX-like permease family protein [Planctomycetes bacterium]|nr:FtsX-like permease family protein [Planctomycetota bacterium]
MSVWRLVAREVLFRKLHFVLGVIAVAVAVGCLVAEFGLLRAHDLRTGEILAAKEAETRARMAELEDSYRKIMKGLGFNVLILPKDQNLSEFHADDFASKTMPEEYAQRLASSGIIVIQHVLPSLQRKIEWPERKRRIIVMGVRGEIPMQGGGRKEPMILAVPKRRVTLGYELHRSLGISEGDEIVLCGRTFTVDACQEERGSKDDITIWMDLGEAQAMLGAEGKINAIYALKCMCAGVGMEKIRSEIGRILPDTQAIEFASQALTRAEARNRAAEEARAAFEAETRNRAHLRGEIEAYGAILVPLILLGAAVWVGLLALGNVRERRIEIGILRAMGVRSRQIFLVFLGKAAAMGLAGALLGYAAGIVAGPGSAALLGAVVAGAPLLAALAAWLPAMLAAQQDPAIVLREE